MEGNGRKQIYIMFGFYSEFNFLKKKSRKIKNKNLIFFSRKMEGIK